MSLLRSMAATTLAADFSRPSAPDLRARPTSSPYRVRRGPDHILFHQLVDQSLAQSFDVHRAARGEVQQRLLALAPDKTVRRCSARPPRPPRARLQTRTPDTSSASRTPRDGRRAGRRHPAPLPGSRPRRVSPPPCRRRHTSFRRTSSSLCKRGVGDGDAAHEHRFEPRHRGERAGASYLHGNIQYFGNGLLGGKFMGHRESRRARYESESFLEFDIVDFVDDAVDVVRQCRARPADVVIVARATLPDP